MNITKRPGSCASPAGVEEQTAPIISTMIMFSKVIAGCYGGHLSTAEEKPIPRAGRAFSFFSPVNRRRAGSCRVSSAGDPEASERPDAHRPPPSHGAALRSSLTVSVGGDQRPQPQRTLRPAPRSSAPPSDLPLRPQTLRRASRPRSGLPGSCSPPSFRPSAGLGAALRFRPPFLLRAAVHRPSRPGQAGVRPLCASPPPAQPFARRPAARPPQPRPRRSLVLGRRVAAGPPQQPLLSQGRAGPLPRAVHPDGGTGCDAQ
ncbi:hypothetical protein ACRRTK_006177 [Alexandromys fortis]